MKKIAIVLFIIGAILMLVDVESMSVFLLTKLIGATLTIPAFKTFKFEE